MVLLKDDTCCLTVYSRSAGKAPGTLSAIVAVLE